MIVTFLLTLGACLLFGAVWLGVDCGLITNLPPKPDRAWCSQCGARFRPELAENARGEKFTGLKVHEQAAHGQGAGPLLAMLERRRRAKTYREAARRVA